MIRHHVLMKFHDPSHANEAAQRLQALGPQIPALLSLEVGLDVLRSDASWDLALVTTHTDLAGLQEYQVHPLHAEFIGWLRPLISGRAAVDVEVA